MKIRRFTGTDMRDAMRQVRAALGADAVILETSRNAAGVEISAAIEDEPSEPAFVHHHQQAKAEAAAGVAGIMKVVLALAHEQGYAGLPTEEPAELATWFRICWSFLSW